MAGGHPHQSTQSAVSSHPGEWTVAKIGTQETPLPVLVNPLLLHPHFTVPALRLHAYIHLAHSRTRESDRHGINKLHQCTGSTVRESCLATPAEIYRTVYSTGTL